MIHTTGNLGGCTGRIQLVDRESSRDGSLYCGSSVGDSEWVSETTQFRGDFIDTGSEEDMDVGENIQLGRNLGSTSCGGDEDSDESERELHRQKQKSAMRQGRKWPNDGTWQQKMTATSRDCNQEAKREAEREEEEDSEPQIQRTVTNRHCRGQPRTRNGVEGRVEGNHDRLPSAEHDAVQTRWRETQIEDEGGIGEGAATNLTHPSSVRGAAENAALVRRTEAGKSEGSFDEPDTDKNRFSNDGGAAVKQCEMFETGEGKREGEGEGEGEVAAAQERPTMMAQEVKCTLAHARTKTAEKDAAAEDILESMIEAKGDVEEEGAAETGIEEEQREEKMMEKADGKNHTGGVDRQDDDEEDPGKGGRGNDTVVSGEVGTQGGKWETQTQISGKEGVPLILKKRQQKHQKETLRTWHNKDTIIMSKADVEKLSAGKFSKRSDFEDVMAGGISKNGSLGGEEDYQLWPVHIGESQPINRHKANTGKQRRSRRLKEKKRDPGLWDVEIGNDNEYLTHNKEATTFPTEDKREGSAWCESMSTSTTWIGNDTAEAREMINIGRQLKASF